MHHRTLISRLDEGVSMTAASTLAICHELLEHHASPDRIADYLRDSQLTGARVSPADVWPQGTPEHWRAVA